ncbi:DNA-binding domain-containing protein [Blastopirellula marina]|uniref:Putative DNA-binding domain-containing protein n=1 Tax=Blastopirellula marina TaxID=124 RepID=A0A2S8FMZ4_9BACT|nr:DNA-binding domain-containing protein [Blastopirellula marina]PQO33561.1 hypothetical protein C5Y98_15070 [Blastopirellula marina]PTL43348.1 DUF2063 domain-containing protein [Blastopirellula marina]
MEKQPPTPRDLPTIQKWFQAVITSADGIAGGVASSAARSWIDIPADELEAVVLPSQKRTSIQRLEVYANAYFARLTECLQAIFPIFARTVGEELFGQFAFGYLQQYPSQSYTLNRLGDRFVDFLNETRPPENGEAPGWADFIICLARLEWGIDQVFDGPGYEGEAVIGPKELKCLSPAEFWTSRPKLVPCLQTFAFSFPVNAYVTASKTEEELAIPQPEPTWLALTRRDYVVRRIPLSHFQYALLRQLASGVMVGEAINVALDETGDPENLPEVLAATFQKLAAEQLILAISTDS